MRPNGSKPKVQKDQPLLVWKAFYRDGEVLYQVHPDTKQEISSELIDRRRLQSFALVDEKGRTILSQDISPGNRFLFRRRTLQGLKTKPIVSYLVVQFREDFLNITLVSIDANGGFRIDHFKEWDPKHPWIYPVVPVESDSHIVGEESRSVAT